ncbi:MAG: SDR family oxidoreductase [Pseudomonadota bacterium]
MTSTHAHRVAVITGGSGGIGAAVARRFHRDGLHVAILDTQREAGAALAAELGERAAFHFCDVTDAAAMDALAARIQQELGQPEILVTSAALTGANFGTVMDFDLEAHDKSWRVNYHGTLHACRSFGRLMIEAQGGSIVTLGSIHGLMPMPSPAYNPGKAALARLTQLLAVELGRFGIRVNGVAPTYVMTDRMRKNFESGRRDEAKMMSVHALESLPDPDDIANAIAFLCSDGAAKITGITLPVDSGLSAAVSYKTYAGGVPW